MNIIIFRFMIAAPVSGEFEEREGESDERRRIRYESYLRAKARMVCVLALRLFVCFSV